MHFCSPDDAAVGLEVGARHQADDDAPEQLLSRRGSRRSSRSMQWRRPSECSCCGGGCCCDPGVACHSCGRAVARGGLRLRATQQVDSNFLGTNKEEHQGTKGSFDRPPSKG